MSNRSWPRHFSSSDKVWTGARAPRSSPTPPIEFVRLELMPLSDGAVSVSLKSTVFDEEELDLIDQDLVHERVTTLDELVALIRAHVRIGRQGQPSPAH